MVEDLWVCALVVLVKHGDDIVGIALEGTQEECEAKAEELRNLEPEQIEIIGADPKDVELRLVTCPASVLGANWRESIN